MALTATERADGFGLMCMAKPLSEELLIEWGAADARPKLFPPRENMPFVVVDKVPRTLPVTLLFSARDANVGDCVTAAKARGAQDRLIHTERYFAHDQLAV
jgi:hypothetical protein